ERRPAETVGAAQVHRRLRTGTLRIVGHERVGAEIAQPHAAFPVALDGRDAELARVLDRAFDELAVRDVRVTRVAARVDAVDAEPRQRTVEERELVTVAPRAALRLHGIRVTDEDQLAVQVEPPPGGRDLD